LCELHGVDLEVKEFENTLAKSEIPSYVWNSNEWLAAKFNWKIIKTTQTISPIVIQNKVIFSKCLNKNILANCVSGLKALVITECENNIVIETSMIGTVYHGDMTDYCSWTIEGL
jgi:2,4-diaminopentanoate dehydrogenase